MFTLNKATIIGIIGNDAEVITTSSGGKIVKFSVATTKSYKKNEEWINETTWHNIVCFGKQAEYLETRAKKSTYVYVEGEIKIDDVDKDGVKKRFVSINAAVVNIITQQDAQHSVGEESEKGKKYSRRQDKNSANTAQKNVSSEPNDEIDDLPF